MPYTELNGLNLYYEEFGRGETVLFLHSHFSRGLLAFSGQILPFSGHYRCLFPDFRGHGRTTCDDLTWNSRMAKANHVVVSVTFFIPCADRHNSAFYLGKGKYETVTGVVLCVEDNALLLRTNSGKHSVPFDDIRDIQLIQPAE